MIIFLFLNIANFTLTRIESKSIQYGHIFMTCLSRKELRKSIAIDDFTSVNLKLYKLSDDYKIVSEVETIFISKKVDQYQIILRFLTLDHNKNSFIFTGENTSKFVYRAAFTINTGGLNSKTLTFYDYFEIREINGFKIILYRNISNQLFFSEIFKKNIIYLTGRLKQFSDQFIFDKFDDFCHSIGSDIKNDFLNKFKLVGYLDCFFQEMQRLYCPTNDKDSFNFYFCDIEHLSVGNHRLLSTLREKCSKLLMEMENSMQGCEEFSLYNFLKIGYERDVIKIELIEALMVFVNILGLENNESEESTTNILKACWPIYIPRERCNNAAKFVKCIYLNEIDKEYTNDTEFIYFRFGNGMKNLDRFCRKVQNRGPYKTFLLLEDDAKEKQTVLAYKLSSDSTNLPTNV